MSKAVYTELNWSEELAKGNHVFTCTVCGQKSSGGDAEHHPVTSKCFVCGGLEKIECPVNCKGPMLPVKSVKHARPPRRKFPFELEKGNVGFCTCDGDFCRENPNDWTDPRCATCGGIIWSPRMMQDRRES